MRKKFRDGDKVWVKGAVVRKTCVGYIVRANGGDILGYVAHDQMKPRPRRRRRPPLDVDSFMRPRLGGKKRGGTR